MIRAVDEYPVQEEDFQSYVDGLLESSRRATVEAFLARHPAEAARASAYRAQNILLHEAFDSVVREPLSIPLDEMREQMADRIGRQRTVQKSLRWASGVLAAGIVAFTAWLGHDRSWSFPWTDQLRNANALTASPPPMAPAASARGGGASILPPERIASRAISTVTPSAPRTGADRAAKNDRIEASITPFIVLERR